MRLYVGISTVAIFAFLFAGLITAQNANDTTTVPPSSSTTSESTPVPKTTHKTTTTETSTKTSGSTAPASSTASVSTSTPVPSTTTSAPGSTTGKPSDVGTWNISCIIATMEVEFVFHNSSLNHILSPHAKTDGSNCKNRNETQLFVLEDGMYELHLLFFNASKTIYVGNISAVYPNFTAPETEKTSGKFFEVSPKKSFKCNSEEEVKFNDLTLKFTKVHIQGFTTDGKYDEAEKCDADITLNDFVPIAVACVLAAMVIIILISYLVFRRQSRQRGYQSV